MKIQAIFVTPDRSVQQYVGFKKISILNVDLCERLKASRIHIEVSAFHMPQNNDQLSGFIEEIEYKLRDYDAVVCFPDMRLVNSISSLGGELLFFPFDHRYMELNAKNCASKIVAAAVKIVTNLKKMIDNEGMRKIILLPKKNFTAEELNEIEKLFVPIVDQSGFVEKMEKCIRKFRERQMPKVSSPYNATFLRDDKGWMFSYGKEIHSHCESEGGGHTKLCALRSQFRYGVRYDNRRHFNVSHESGPIRGSRHDCHDSVHNFGPLSHLNMFPNDFCA